MNKFKIGDKVRFTSNTEIFLIGDEGTVVRVDNDGEPRLRMNVLGGKLVSDEIRRYGLDSIMEIVVDKKAEKKAEKQLPLCYAEIQKENLDENCKVRDSIEKDLAVDIGGVSFRFDGDNFLIGSSFYLPIKEAVEAGKWFRKMTATPKKKAVKKVVKKVAKKKVGRPAKKKVAKIVTKKVAKKLDLLKLSKK